MAITLTETAADRVKSHLESRGRGEGLRLGVKQAGCSGLGYTIDYADAITAEDTVFESHGVKVIVRAEDLAFLDGTEIDYRSDGFSSAFHFNNPNVTEQCGCGESFTTR